MNDLQISTDNISPPGKIIDTSRESLRDRLTFEVVMSYDFLIGLVIPAIPSIASFILFMFVDPYQDTWIGNYRLQREEIAIYFMFTLICWPIIAFTLARGDYIGSPQRKISQNMNTGFIISAMIGMVVGALVWLPILAIGRLYA